MSAPPRSFAKAPSTTPSASRCGRSPRGGPGHYEAALLLRGEMAFRPASDHDWFNLLSWRVWPRAKAALNLRHTLHYLAALRRRHPGRHRRLLGARLARDRWMQALANLDEGGCVASARLLGEHTRLDERRVRQWSAPPDEAQVRAGLRWFGHAVLEHLHLGRPTPRCWVAGLEQPCDEELARRILVLDPVLEPSLLPVLAELPPLAPALRGAARFAEGDLFARPVESIWPPWGKARPPGAPERPAQGSAASPA